MLSWKFDGTGAWEAVSLFDSLMWRIVVCDDGSFDVSESDPGMTQHKTTFSGLDAAKSFCQREEHIREGHERTLPMNQARFKARDAFRQWNDVSGVFNPGSGYYSEILSVIDDAVQCGWEAHQCHQ